LKSFREKVEKKIIFKVLNINIRKYNRKKIVSKLLDINVEDYNLMIKINFL